jgi:hypothetical protein
MESNIMILGSRRPYLTCLTGGAAAKRIDILNIFNLIGSDGSYCQIVLNSNLISPSHATLEVDQTRAAILVDLASTNGTYVNGERITRHEIMEGDQIAFGPTGEFIFVYRSGLSTPVDKLPEPSDLEDRDGTHNRVFSCSTGAAALNENTSPSAERETAAPQPATAVAAAVAANTALFNDTQNNNAKITLSLTDPGTTLETVEEALDLSAEVSVPTPKYFMKSPKQFLTC